VGMTELPNSKHVLSLEEWSRRSRITENEVSECADQDNKKDKEPSHRRV